MEEQISSKPPMWFRVVSGLALVWNLLGVMAYLAQVTMSAEDFAKLPEVDQAMMAASPVWYTAAFAVAVFAGALGCLGLLLRKKWAFSLLVLSFIGVALQQIYHFLLSDIGSTLDGEALGMAISIPIVSILLIGFARHSVKKGWLS